MALAPTLERDDTDTTDDLHHLEQCHDEDTARCGADISGFDRVEASFADCEICLLEDANEPDDHCTCLCCFDEML